MPDHTNEICDRRGHNNPPILCKKIDKYPKNALISIYKKGNSKKEPESYEVFNDESKKGNIKVIKEGYIKKKSNEISTNNIKNNIIKNKFIYKKSGNLSEKKLTKINSSNIKSHIRVNDLSNNDPKIMQKIQI